jgi:hypothetical protein
MNDMPTIEPNNERPESSAKARSRAHLWKPGQSGNPAGTKRGSRHRASLLAESLLDGETDRLTRRCIYEALKGDTVALRLCMERILPPLKSRPIRFRLPVLHTIADAQAALAAIVADGQQLAFGTFAIASRSINTTHERDFIIGGEHHELTENFLHAMSIAMPDLNEARSSTRRLRYLVCR